MPTEAKGHWFECRHVQFFFQPFSAESTMVVWEKDKSMIIDERGKDRGLNPTHAKMRGV